MSFTKSLAMESAGDRYVNNLKSVGLPVGNFGTSSTNVDPSYYGAGMDFSTGGLAEASKANTPDLGKNLSFGDRFKNLLGIDGKGGIFGLSSETMGTLGDVGSVVGGLASTFGAMEQLDLAKDAFNFNKELKEKEYAMAKDAYDKNVKRAKSVGSQMRAGSVG